MNQRKTLVALTLAEVLLLVGVLAGYLVAIAVRLRSISNTLAQVTFGVRAIETQTAPIGPHLRDINGALGQVAGALQDVARPAADPPQPGIDAPDDRPRPTTP